MCPYHSCFSWSVYAALWYLQICSWTVIWCPKWQMYTILIKLLVSSIKHLFWVLIELTLPCSHWYFNKYEFLNQIYFRLVCSELTLCCYWTFECSAILEGMLGFQLHTFVRLKGGFQCVPVWSFVLWWTLQSLLIMTVFPWCAHFKAFPCFLIGRHFTVDAHCELMMCPRSTVS